MIHGNTLVAWGQNNCGQLGIGDTEDRLVPTKIELHESVAHVSCGWRHTVALTKNGNTLFGWGHFGIARDSTVSSAYSTPEKSDRNKMALTPSAWGDGEAQKYINYPLIVHTIWSHAMSITAIHRLTSQSVYLAMRDMGYIPTQAARTQLVEAYGTKGALQEIASSRTSGERSTLRQDQSRSPRSRKTQHGSKECCDLEEKEHGWDQHHAYMTDTHHRRSPSGRK